MASPTRILKRRREMKNKNKGRRRKKRLAREGPTPTMAVLFGDAVMFDNEQSRSNHVFD